MAKKIIKKEGKKKENRNDRQLKWIVAVMVLILLVAVGVYFFMNKSKTYKYGGISFEKIMFDKLPLEYSRIPLTDIDGNVLAYYNMYLRNDPRDLRNIYINGSIMLMKDTIISVDESINGCPDTGIAGYALGIFLDSASGRKHESALANKTVAEEKNMTYADCEDEAGNPTVIFDKSIIVVKDIGKNEIIRKNQNCYVIGFKDCEIEKSVERFMVGAIANSKGITI